MLIRSLTSDVCFFLMARPHTGEGRVCPVLESDFPGSDSRRGKLTISL